MKILLILGLIIIVGMVFKSSSDQSAAVVSAPISLKTVLVDKTEDSKAIGYTGQRKVVSDGDGNLYVTYRKKYQDYYENYVAKIIPSGDTLNVQKPHNPVSIVGGQTNQRVGSIALDSNGLYFIWYGVDNKNDKDERQIKFASSFDKATIFSKWVNISPVSGYGGQNLWQEHPDIITGSDGALYATWEGRDRDYNSQQIKFFKSSDQGKTWSSWVNIQPVKNKSFSRPSLIQDLSGKLYIFVYSSLSGIQQIYFTTSSDLGTTWSQWQNVSNSQTDSRHVASLLDDKGNIHLVWRSYDKNKKTQIIYSKFNGQSWQSPIIVSSKNSYQFFPNIAVDQDENIYIVWMETTNKSNYPEDNPKYGDLKLVKLNKSLQKITDQKMDTKSLYPSLNFNKKLGKVFLFYSKYQSSNSYNLYISPI